MNGRGSRGKSRITQHIRKLVAAALVLAALTTTRPATALTVNYAEDFSGDLGIPSTLFAFDIGTNMVSGSICAGLLSVLQCRDADPFRFNIATGGKLNDVSLTFVLTDVVPGTIQALTFFDLDLGIRDLAEQTVDLFGTSPVSVFGTALPLGHEPFVQYSVDNDVLATPSLTPGLTNGGWRADYTWQFVVTSASGGDPGGGPEPVPEPAFLLWISAAGLGFGGIVRALHRRNRLGLGLEAHGAQAARPPTVGHACGRPGPG